MSVSRKLELLISIVFLASVAQAGEGSGRISVEGLQLLTEPPSPVTQTEGRGEIEYNRKFSLGESKSFRFHPFVYGNTADQAWERQVTFDPREMYVDYTHGIYYVRLGYETLKFEGTDGINPMDMAAMRDLGDPLASPTRASGGIHVGYSGEKTDFEVMYIPHQTESSVPGPNSVWWPRRLTLPLRNSTNELLIPEHLDYVILPRKEEDEALSNNVVARFQWRTNYGDLALAGFEGASDTPAFHPVLNLSTIPGAPQTTFLIQSPVQIIPVDYRRRTAAGLISIPIGSWIVRAAARYDQPLGDSPEVKTWSQQTVAGVEKSVEIGSNTVTAIVQGCWVRHPDGASLLSIQDVLDKAVLFGLRYPMGESWSLLIGGFQSTKDSSFVGQGTLTRRWESGWSVEAGWLGIDGPSDSLLGSFAENDRATLTVTRSF